MKKREGRPKLDLLTCLVNCPLQPGHETPSNTSSQREQGASRKLLSHSHLGGAGANGLEAGTIVVMTPHFCANERVNSSTISLVTTSPSEPPFDAARLFMCVLNCMRRAVISASVFKFKIKYFLDTSIQKNIFIDNKSIKYYIFVGVSQPIFRLKNMY